MTVSVTSLAIKVESQGIREASQALGGLSTSAGNATKRVGALESAMKQLNAINLTTVQNSNALTQALQRQATILAGMDASLAGARSGAAGLAAAMANLSTSLVILNQQLVLNQQRQRQSNEAMREGHAAARGLAGSLGVLWATYGNPVGIGVGIAIGTALKGIVSVGKDVQHTLEEIRVLGGASTQEIGEMSKIIHDLGQGAQGPRDVAEALQVLTLAGLDAKEAMTGVGAALNLAVAGGVTIEKSAETLVQVSTSLGYTAEGFDHVADVIAKTAAASMSSVDSISGAFKSASSVGEVYGATLQDIAVGLAAIANLGIQGTAAGTALKNFYKDITSGSEKVTGTLKAMGMSLKDLRDEQGFVVPLVDLITKLNDGLGTLTGAARNDAIGKLFGERGVKEAAALLKLVNTASEEYDEMGNKYKNRLVELAADIEKAAAFSTTAAIAMSQTASNQMKSVANTLQTAFAQAFTAIQPQIGQVSRLLKDLFNSKEFQDGLRSLVTGVMSLTRLLVEHAGVIANVIQIYLGFKAVEFAAGLVKIAQGFELAGVAARIFQASLGPIGIAIAGLTTAWLIYKGVKNDALDNEAAGGNLKEYAENLKQAAEKEDEALKMRLAGRTEMDIARKAQIDADKQASAAAIKASESQMNAWKKQLADQFSALSDSEKKRAQMIDRGEVSHGTQNTIRYIENARNFSKALSEHNDLVDKVTARTDQLTKSRKANADAADAAAKAARVKPTGTGELAGAPDRAGINDAYAKAIAEQQNVIKAAMRAMENDERAYTNAVKAGAIGRKEAIDLTTQSQIANYDKIIEANKRLISQAEGGKNKDADVARFTGDLDAAIEAQSQARRKSAEETAIYMNELARENVRTEIKNLEDKGQYVEAASLRWSAEYKAMYESMARDAAKYGEQYPILVTYLQNFGKVKDDMMNSARVRELSKEFDALALSISNSVKGVAEANDGGSMIEMYNAAAEAADRYKAKLPELNAEIMKLYYGATASGSADDMKKYEEAVAKKTKLAKDYSQMWSDTAKNIGNSLEKAFGKQGKIVGDMIKTVKEFDAQENQSTASKMRMYGDLAGSAAGFFDEQSKGYKVLQTVSQAFHAFEIAQIVAKNVQLGISAVLNQASGDPYTAFARMAAMVAVVAALGVAISGGGGGGASSSKQRQETQGTGSILGDSAAKSESIANSLEIVAKNSGLGLVHSANAEKYLKNISDNITGLASLIVRSTGINGDMSSLEKQSQAQTLHDKYTLGSLGEKLTGGLMGKVFGSIFGGKTTVEDTGFTMNATTLANAIANGVTAQQYTDVKKDGGWFRSDKKSTQLNSLGSEADSQFTKIIESFSAFITDAANTIGIGGDEFTQHLGQFVIDLGKISLKGLKGDEIQAELEAVFSKLGDDMANFAVDGLSKYQQVGEGALETLTRIANDFMQVQDVLAVLGKSFNVTGMAAVDLTEGLIESAGSLEKLTEGTKYLMDNFLTDQEKYDSLAKSVNTEFARLNVSGVSTVAQFKDLVLAQDLNTKAGQDMYAALINMAPSFYQMTELLDKVGEGSEATNKMRDLEVELLRTVGDEVRAIAKEREAELAALIKLDPALAEVQKKIWAISDLKDAANTAHDALTKAIEAEKKAAQEKYNTEIERINKLKTAAKDAYEAQKATIKDSLDKEKERNSSLDSLYKSLKSTLETLLPGVSSQAMRMDAAQDILKKALENAKNGIFATADELSGALKTVTEDRGDSYSDYNVYKRDLGFTAVTVSELEKVTGKAKSVSDKQLDALNAALDAADREYDALTKGFETAANVAKEALDAEVNRLDKLSDLAAQQIDIMNGTYAAVLDLNTAMAQFSSAVSAAVSASNGVRTGDGVGGGGVALAAPSTTAYLNNLYKTVLGRDPDKTGFDWWKKQLDSGAATHADVLNGFYNSDERKALDGSHASGLDEVPRDNYIARLHKGEMVVPAAQAEKIRAGEQAEQLKTELAGMRSDQRAQNDKIIELQSKTWKFFDRIAPGQDSLQVTIVSNS